MQKAVSSRVAILAFALILARPIGVSAQRSKLSLAQVQKLVSIHAPDNAVAQEIRSRGLGFVPTAKFLDALQRAGAGQATLTALREQMPVGTVEVQAPPGSQIAIDSVDQGVTDGQGRLILADLPVGQHRLSARKPGYNPREFDFELAQKERKVLPVQLDWAGGFLTVRANAPGAIIEIAGLGHYRDRISDLPCPPGRYDVAVSATGMRLETQSVVVTPGQHAAIEVHLVADPEYLHRSLAEARQRLERGDVQGAIQVSNSLLSLKPNDPDVEGFLAGAYLRAHDLQHFQGAAAEAIGGGRSVTLELAHEHLELSGEAIHPATLTLTATSIAYDPKGAACKYGSFVTPLANVDAVGVTGSSQSGFLVTRHLSPGTSLLHLRLRDPAKRSARISLSFATAGSRIEHQTGVGLLVSAPGSSQLLTVVANVIRSAKTGSGR